MSFKIEKIGDILVLLSDSCSNNLRPKRMTFDLSESGTFYYTKIYVDVIDRSKNEKYEAYIETKTDINFANDFNVLCNYGLKSDTIFTMTIPEIEGKRE